MTSAHSTPNGLSVSRHDIGAPLDAQFGVHPALTMPEGAGPVLFDPEQVEQTFALIDAAAVFGLAEQLAASGLAHCCLFDGAAAQDTGDAAPWLVQLTPDAPLTRDLLTAKDATLTALFGRGASVFLRSSAEMDKVRAWLRKFTRLRDPDGAWRFFRFCDSVAMLHLAQHSDARGMILEQMLAAPDPVTLIVPDARAPSLVVVKCDTAAPTAILPQPVCLTEGDLRVLSDRTRIKHIDMMVDKLTRALPSEMAAMDPQEHHRHIAQLVFYFERLGFRQLRSLVLLCGWTLRHGADFGALDGDGQVSILLQSEAPEHDRIASLTDIIAARSAALPLAGEHRV